MVRSLLVLLGLLAITWFEFEVYPGHTYLRGETLLLVPMLERLDTPGFLSRDLVAANPNFAYTIYDEITESLHVGARVGFQEALVSQQILFRFAAVMGLFLLARAIQISPWAAVLISASVNAVTHLALPETFVTNPEATPRAFAISLVLLAAGLMSQHMPLLGGLAAGLALVYDPMTAAAFWLVVAVAWLADKSVRRKLRPVWLALVIFSLILANLVQLQSGLGAGQEITARMSEGMVQLTRIRTPWVWVTNWEWRGILNYVFLLVAGLWAMARIWKHTDPITRWMTLGLAAAGFVGAGAALILLLNQAQLAAGMTPARNLAFTAAIAVLLCGAAGWHAVQNRKWAEGVLWVTLVMAAVANGQVLDLLNGKVDYVRRSRPPQAIQALAQWAEKQTWGSSLFQFLDAGKSDDPEIFRALSKRAIWADWRSGEIADFSDNAGQEWWSRWRAGMSKPYSLEIWPTMLRQPIDYYVLERGHELKGVKPAYADSRYVVYEAQDLREKSRLQP